MGTIVTSEGMVIYYGHGITWKGGDPSSDAHIPLNPMTSGIGLKLPEQLYELIATPDSMYPNIELDKTLDPTTITLRMYFKDPFLLLDMFTYKTVTASWTGTNDVITGAFTNRNNENTNIWIQLQIRDQTGNHNHVNLFFDGGKIIKYMWDVVQGDAMFEEVDIKFAEITESYRVVDITDGFDDGKFDQTGVAEISTITAKAANDMTTSTYFHIYLASGTGSETKYHVWFKKDGAGADPAPTGSTAILVTITTDQTAATVATAIGAALDAAADGFGTPVVATALVTVTQASTGDITDIVDGDSGLTVATTTQGKDALDGGWSNWDGTYGTNAVVLAKDCTITVGNAAPAGIQLKDCSMTISVPKEMEHVQSSATAAITYDKAREPYIAELKGVLSGNQAITQAITALSSKTQSTVKFLYGTTKYMQFTLGVLKNIDGLSIPASGESINVTYVYEGAGDAVLSFSWTGSESNDPSALINHSNP